MMRSDEQPGGEAVRLPDGRRGRIRERADRIPTQLFSVNRPEYVRYGPEGPGRLALVDTFDGGAAWWAVEKLERTERST